MKQPINSGKTKCMAVNQEFLDLDITVNNKRLDNVDSFVYLGSTMSADGSLSAELNNRIGKAAGAFKSLLPVFVSNISCDVKMKIFQAVVTSTLLYSAETWNISVTDENRLSAFYNRCLRRIMGITWTDRISNRRLYEMSNQTSLITILRKKRLNWFGHVVRMNNTRLPNRLMFWSPSGRRRRGRRPTTWLDTIERDLAQLDITSDEAATLAKDRNQWNHLVTALCVCDTTAPE